MTSELKTPILNGHNVKVSVVIPALNEEENLPYVLPRIPLGIDEVIIVSTPRLLKNPDGSLP